MNVTYFNGSNGLQEYTITTLINNHYPNPIGTSAMNSFEVIQWKKLNNGPM